MSRNYQRNFSYNPSGSSSLPPYSPQFGAPTIPPPEEHYHGESLSAEGHNIAFNRSQISPDNEWPKRFFISSPPQTVDSPPYGPSASMAWHTLTHRECEDQTNPDIPPEPPVVQEDDGASLRDINNKIWRATGGNKAKELLGAIREYERTSSNPDLASKDQDGQFKCNWGQCTYSSSRIWDHMAPHSASHLGVRNRFICDDCYVGYERKQELKNHNCPKRATGRSNPSVFASNRNLPDFTIPSAGPSNPSSFTYQAPLLSSHSAFAVPPLQIGNAISDTPYDTRQNLSYNTRAAAPTYAQRLQMGLPINGYGQLGPLAHTPRQEPVYNQQTPALYISIQHSRPNPSILGSGQGLMEQPNDYPAPGQQTQTLPQWALQTANNAPFFQGGGYGGAAPGQNRNTFLPQDPNGDWVWDSKVCSAGAMEPTRQSSGFALSNSKAGSTDRRHVAMMAIFTISATCLFTFVLLGA